MEIILLLVLVSGVLLGAMAWSFLWAVDNEQFDDLEAQGRAILMDEEETAPQDDAP